MEVVEFLADCLEKNITLETLSLVNNLESLKEVEILCKALEKNTYSKALHLPLNKIGWQGAAVLATTTI